MQIAGALTPIDKLAADIDELAAEDVQQLADGVLGTDLVALRRLVDRIEAEFIRRVERFDRTHGALADGAVSTVSWLRAGCGLTGAAAADRVRMARVLPDLPQTWESFRAGRAGFFNVSLIARLAEDVGTDRVGAVEDTLAPAAEKLDARRMHHLVAVTRHYIDPDGALDAENRNHERRWFSCDQVYGGVFMLRGELDAENGAIVKTALDALSAPTGPDDQRLGSQRRADALVELASRQLQSGSLPAVHGQRPHLTVTVDLATLQELRGAAPAELEGAGPVHAQTARRIACDSVLTLVAVDCNNEPVSLSRASRTIPAHIRTALQVRDRGCRFPGCDRPHGWTDGHHIKHWADGGETRLDNLVSLCRPHHDMVHKRGWTIGFAPGRTVAVTGPTACPPSRVLRGAGTAEAPCPGVGLVVGHRRVPVHRLGKPAGLAPVEPHPAGLGVGDQPLLDAEIKEFHELVGVQRVKEAHLADQPLPVAREVHAEVREGQQHGAREVAEFVHHTDGNQPK
jgi:hypothetical protein